MSVFFRTVFPLSLLIVFAASFWRGHGDELVERARRQVPPTNNVELLVAVDKAAYDKYLAKNGGNTALAQQELTRYIAGLIKEVNERFASLSPPGASTPLVKVTLGTIIFLTTTADSSATETNKAGTQVNGDAALLAFSSQSNTLWATLPHDYAILLTGYDVRRGDGSDADVRMWSSGICSSTKQGIVENFGNELTALAMAKVIALALGAPTDGTGSATACANSNYVMSPTFVPPAAGNDTQPFQFSSCSAQAVQSFLTQQQTQCLRTNSVTNPVDVPGLTTTELGQTYNADQQCSLRYGNGSALCRDQYGLSPNFTYDNGLCRDMRCTVANTTTCQTPGTLPFDGTTCGNLKWCQDGLCVTNLLAPTTPTATCPQGDQPPVGGGSPCQPSLCNTLSGIYRNYTCCQTCSSVPPPTAPPPTVPGPVSVAGVNVTNAPTPTPAPAVSVAGVNNTNVTTPAPVVPVSVAGVNATNAPTPTPAPAVSVAGVNNTNVTTPAPVVPVSVAGVNATNAPTPAPAGQVSVAGVNNTNVTTPAPPVPVSVAGVNATNAPTPTPAPAVSVAGVNNTNVTTVVPLSVAGVNVTNAPTPAPSPQMSVAGVNVTTPTPAGPGPGPGPGPSPVGTTLSINGVGPGPGPGPSPVGTTLSIPGAGGPGPGPGPSPVGTTLSIPGAGGPGPGPGPSPMGTTLSLPGAGGPGPSPVGTTLSINE